MEGPGEFERVLDAFGHRYRRRLLVALARENPQDDDDPQEAEEALGIVGETADDSRVELRLRHVHLPKLSEYGYIEWDRETGDISTGPNWDEVEPMLQLLDDHADELPDDWL